MTSELQKVAAIAKQMNEQSEAIYVELRTKWGEDVADLISEIANMMILTKWVYTRLRSRAFAEEAAKSCSIMLSAVVSLSGKPKLEVDAAIQRFLAAREFTETTNTVKGES